MVSQRGALNARPFALADYYDVLARNAFGNFRQLMEHVTLHPAMGVYLSMLGNRKPDPALNIRPDENYARELMQLFTIGLVQLNPDGTIQTDGLGAADSDLRPVGHRGIRERIYWLELLRCTSFLDGEASNHITQVATDAGVSRGALAGREKSARLPGRRDE